MATTATSRPPVRISKVANRYLLFDIDDVIYLRRNHNIGSVYIGLIPQNPQQNVFNGLPVELMPEEAQVLVKKKAAYVVDDAVFHLCRLTSLDYLSRRAYEQSLQAEGRQAQLMSLEYKLQNTPDEFRNKQKKTKTKLQQTSSEANVAGSLATVRAAHREEEPNLFDASPPTSRRQSQAPKESSKGWPVTPTTSGILLTPPPELDTPSVPVDTPPSYPLFAHLQHKGYFTMPGIRFGCDYNVYPGDPLRFHSHFQATSYGWEEQINLIDIVACGRLGTNVKKSYLIGGEVSGVSKAGVSEKEQKEVEEGVPPPVRCFSIEWAVM
ncbi:uncharacterized protein BCR38DRAFT_444625 [Pseudomassariella vexata]|uniref:tRNA-splicing endonuclease subunit Sen34 n=1 Tax=Pseudomassariella vexata TaxID=1141098 RepID=A0A1Y2DL75_9PEZI|nr:uncharacterized protein BCR38DRAFT_444625 [Pseudomassariella vexata]ORY59475.1 hypothetical protein BCR38DRAFT_444625 [Pseudomassariella vexata]